jgi:hypothetical protein
MIELLMAAALAQAQAPAPDPCNAAGTSAPPSQCRHWRSVWTDPYGEMYVDPASVARTGNSFIMTMRRMSRADDSQGARSMIATMRFDCARRETTMLHVTLYNARGVILRDSDMGGEVAQPTAPGTNSNRLMDEYCPARPAPADNR